MKKLKTIKASLVHRGVPTEMVGADVGPGQILAIPSTKKFRCAKMMVVFCTGYYGAKTARYGTLQELRYARATKNCQSSLCSMAKFSATASQF